MSFFDRPLRAAILAAADNAAVQRAVSRYGMRLGAKRFVAGERAEDFLAVTRRLNDEGFCVACGILGEGVRSFSDAQAACDQYCSMLATFARDGLDANVAFKLTHLGLDIDAELAFAHASRIAQTALDGSMTMRLDMEQSRYVDATLDIYRRLRETYANVGFVLQSYLYRSVDDLHAVLSLAPNVRLVKGAYLEPPDVAFASKADVDENYLRLAEIALTNPGYTAIATHDPAMIAGVEAIVARERLPLRGRFEFQMLYGVSVQLARRLLKQGYRVRLAVPYGDYWFPYLMRRLAERPANLAFFLKGALGRS